MRRIQKWILILMAFSCASFYWGFFAHQKINRLAVFMLPSEMIGFYKKNIDYITEASVAPDRRRYAVKDEAPRHFIDLEDYGDSAVTSLPRHWNDALTRFGEDTLMARGIVPWHIMFMFAQLKDAFLLGDPEKILRLSSELGHYVADANVPLHTTSNYDGQKTGQDGLHALWESRLPELFADQYDFYVGKANYINDVATYTWFAIERAHGALDSVLTLEKQLYERIGTKKYNFETKGKGTSRVVSQTYASQYHELLNHMVERQMKNSIKMIGDLWFTAWVDAGQPNLKKLIDHQPSQEELQRRKEELKIYRSAEYDLRNNAIDTIR